MSSAAGLAHVLEAVAATRISSARDLSSLHDDLLFLAAFPPDRRARRLAIAGLDAMARRVAALAARQRRLLDDSGIAGTVSRSEYIYGAAWWIARRTRALAFERRGPLEALDPLLRLTHTAAESASFESGERTTRQWLSLCAGAPADAAPWLLARAPHPVRSPLGPTWRALWDEAGLSIAWRLSDARWATTGLRAPGTGVTVRRAFRAPPAQVRAELLAPLSGIRKLDPREARRWIDASIGALLARCREVEPTIYANSREVYLADLGEGTCTCILGVDPTLRLPLEANYGYVMFANGIPVGYGGVTPLAAQANTGANLFGAFRRSEAAALFTQSLRAFRTLFGTERFVVNPYQFGQDNPEALASGAYWFYDRLGFRLADPALARLATRERDHLARDHRHRSSIAVLRRLASCDAVLDLRPAQRFPFMSEALLTHVGRLVAQRWVDVPAGGRAEAFAELGRDVRRLLAGSGGRSGAQERLGLGYLAPVIDLVRGAVARWTADDRRSLWRVVVAKGAPAEREFARLAARHGPFWEALARCAG